MFRLTEIGRFPPTRDKPRSACITFRSRLHRYQKSAARPVVRGYLRPCSARKPDLLRALPRRYWDRTDFGWLRSRLDVPRNCPMTGRETAAVSGSQGGVSGGSLNAAAWIMA